MRVQEEGDKEAEMSGANGEGVMEVEAAAAGDRSDDNVVIHLNDLHFTYCGPGESVLHLPETRRGISRSSKP